MSSPIDYASLIDIDGTMGAAFVGMILSTACVLFSHHNLKFLTLACRLWGVSNLQLYIYYRQFPTDWIVYRVSVSIAFPHTTSSFQPLDLGCAALVAGYIQPCFNCSCCVLLSHQSFWRLSRFADCRLVSCLFLISELSLTLDIRSFKVIHLCV